MDYNFLVGQPLLILPYVDCKIDTVEPELVSDRNYRVVVKNYAFGKKSKPKSSVLKNPTLDLGTYLDISGIGYVKGLKFN